MASVSTMATAAPLGLETISAATAPTASACLDTFKTEYHPHSNRPTAVESFSAYGRSTSESDAQSPIIDADPWHPFTCREDFEFAELAHKAALNKDQTNDLLKLIWRIAEGRTKFTFRSHADITTAWARASSQMTPVRAA